MAREEEKLVLGKGAAFVKGRLKRLRPQDETWEADFQALPKPITQSRTDYRGMVVAPDGSVLADRTAHLEGFPEPVHFGAHGGIKHFYGQKYRRELPGPEYPATLDHILAGVAG